MRLKTQIWVQAYLRRCEIEGLYGAVVHKGAQEAGAVYVHVNRLDGTGLLFEPAPGPSYDERGERRFFLSPAEPQPNDAIMARLVRLRERDPDIWIVEIEDRHGQALLNIAGD
jgi:hypothetical protein